MALTKIVIESVNRRIDEYAKEVEGVMKGEAPVGSGALRDSITTEKKGEGHYLVGVDAGKLAGDPRNKTGTDYSVPVHNGHRTYRVTAKNAKALHWIGKDGKDHFAKSVTIPASAGNPFVIRTVAKRPKI